MEKVTGGCRWRRCAFEATVSLAAVARVRGAPSGGSDHLRFTPFTMFVASASLPDASKLGLTLGAASSAGGAEGTSSSYLPPGLPHCIVESSASSFGRLSRRAGRSSSPRSAPLAWSTSFIESESFPASAGSTLALTVSPTLSTSSTASTRSRRSCEMWINPCVLRPSNSTNAPKGFSVRTRASPMVPGNGKISGTASRRSGSRL